MEYDNHTAKTLGISGLSYKGFIIDDIFTTGSNVKQMPSNTSELLRFHILRATLDSFYQCIDFWHRISGDLMNAKDKIMAFLLTWGSWIFQTAEDVEPRSHRHRRFRHKNSVNNKSKKNSNKPALLNWITIPGLSFLKSYVSIGISSLQALFPPRFFQINLRIRSAEIEQFLSKQKSPNLIKREIAKLGTLPGNIGFILEFRALLEPPPNMEIPQPQHLKSGKVVNPSQKAIDQAQSAFDAYEVKTAVHLEREKTRLIQDIAFIVTWCAIAGIKRVSIYEDSGILLTSHEAIWKAISNNFTLYFNSNYDSLPDQIEMYIPSLDNNVKFKCKDPSISEPWSIDLTLLDGNDCLKKAATIGNLYLEESYDGSLIVDAENVRQSLLELTLGPIELLYIFGPLFVTVQRFPKASIQNTVIMFDSSKKWTMNEYMTGEKDPPIMITQFLQLIFGNPPDENSNLSLDFFYQGLRLYSQCLQSDFSVLSKNPKQRPPRRFSRRRNKRKEKGE